MPRKAQLFLVVSVAVVIGSFNLAHASPLYTPGQTLDPACLPSNPDCTVLLTSATSSVAGYFTATSTSVASTFPIMTNGVVADVHSNGSINYYNATSTGNTGNGMALLVAISKAQAGDSLYLSSGTFDLNGVAIDLSNGNTENVSLHGSGKYSTVITTSIYPVPVITLASSSQLTDVSIINTSNSSNVFAIGDNGNAISSTTVSNVFALARNDAIEINASSTIYFYNIKASGGHRGLNAGGAYPDYPSLYIYDSELDGTGNGGTTESVGINNSSQGTTTLFNTNLNASGSLYCFGNDTAGGSANFTYIYGGVITANCITTNDYLFQSGSAFVGVSSNTQYNPTQTAGTITHLDNSQLSYSLGSSGASSTVLINANGVATWVSTSSLGIGGGTNYFSNTGATTTLTTGSIFSAGTALFGSLTATSTLTVSATTTTTGLSVGSLSGLLWGNNGAVSAVSTSSLGLASASAFTALTASLGNGFDGLWNGSTFVNSLLLSNGSVAGINATSSSYTFNIKGTPGINPLNVASSSGASLLAVTNNGNVGIGTSSPSNKLEVAGNGYFAGNITSANITATGTLAVTGNTVLANASTTNISASGSLNVTGQTTLSNASTTNVTVSNNLNVTGTTTVQNLNISSLANLTTGASTPLVASTASLLAKFSVSMWGDSLTQGLFNDPTIAYMINQQLSTSLVAPVNNFGITGQTTSQIVSRFLNAPERWNDYTILWTGTNDGGLAGDYTSGLRSTIMSGIATVVSKLPTGSTSYLILTPVLLYSVTNASGTPWTDYTTLRNSIATTYPNNYLDVYNFLRLTCNNIGVGGNNTGYYASSTQDQIDCTNGVIPSDLMYFNAGVNSSHLGQAGANLLATKIASIINANSALVNQSASLSYADLNQFVTLAKASMGYFSSSTLSNVFLGGGGQYGGDTTSVLNMTDAITGSQNTALGWGSMGAFPSSGSGNTALGFYALKSIQTGYNNTAVGDNALGASGPGFNDVGIGDGAGFSGSNGGYNVSIGSQADADSPGSTQNGNVFIGYYAGVLNTNTSNNVMIGYQSGFPNGANANTTGQNNVWLGDDTGEASTSQISNTVAIGSGVTVMNSNSVVIGNSAITTGGIGTSSPSAKWTVWGNGIGASSTFNTINSAGTVTTNFQDSGTGYLMGPIGIGSTSPSQALSVAGNGFFTGNLTAGNVTATGTLNISGIATFTSTSTFAGAVGIGTTSPIATLSVKGVTGLNPFVISSSSNTQLLTLLQNGNFGIGSSSPSSLLTVTGTSNVSASLFTISSSSQNLFQFMNTAGRTGNAGAELRLFGDKTVPTNYAELFSDTDEGNGTVEAFYILPPAASDRIYFGDTNKPVYSLNFKYVSVFESLPYYMLQNVSTDANNCPVTSCDVLGNNSGGNLVLDYAGGGYIENPEITTTGLGPSSLSFKSFRNILSTYASNVSASGAFVFDTATTTVGLFGVPQTDWKVNGSVIMELEPTGKLVIGSSSPATSTDASLTVQGVVGSNTLLIASSSGAQLVKVASDGSLQLNKYGAGTLQTDSNGNVTVSSDERLKTFEGDFTRGLSAIMGLTPINYKWQAFTGLDTVNTYTGFFAQNVQQYIPEAVGSSSDGYLTLQDRPIIATLVNAVQQLAGMIQNIVADSITAVTGVFTNLTVGSQTQPSGITLYDKVTGEPYCVSISQGQLVPTQGACTNVTSTSSSSVVEQGTVINTMTVTGSTGGSNGTNINIGTTTSITIGTSTATTTVNNSESTASSTTATSTPDNLSTTTSSGSTTTSTITPPISTSTDSVASSTPLVSTSTPSVVVPSVASTTPPVVSTPSVSTTTPVVTPLAPTPPTDTTSGTDSASSTGQ